MKTTASTRQETAVRVIEGRFGRGPAFFVFDAVSQQQIGAFFGNSKGLRMVSRWHDGRRYACSRRFSTAEALMHANHWTPVAEWHSEVVQ